MKLGHSGKDRFLTRERRSKMVKIGAVLFFSGMALLIMSFRIFPVVRIPTDYVSITFTLSFIMIPTGVLLVMIARFYHGLSYILALVVFLVLVGGMANMQTEEADPGKIDVCCEVFVEEDGCTTPELPENFDIWFGEEKIDCRDLTPGTDIYSWRSICDC